MSKLLEVGILVGSPAQRKMLRQVVPGHRAHAVLDQELGHDAILICESKSIAAAHHSSIWSFQTSCPRLMCFAISLSPQASLKGQCHL